MSVLCFGGYLHIFSYDLTLGGHKAGPFHVHQFPVVFGLKEV